MIYNIFHGFCMAMADSVPGVSGGTVAYILGFYERFIDALHYLFSGSMRERKEALRYLLKLGVGWIIGMVSSVLVLAQLFESHIYFLTSLFLGLTLAALPFVYKEEKEVISGHGRNIVWLVIGLALVCGMVFFRDSATTSGAVDFMSLSLGQGVYVFISGALAISAMVLPGVSGSTVLLIMGVYMPAISAAWRAARGCCAHCGHSLRSGCRCAIFARSAEASSQRRCLSDPRAHARLSLCHHHGADDARCRRAAADAGKLQPARFCARYCCAPWFGKDQSPRPETRSRAGRTHAVPKRTLA